MTNALPLALGIALSPFPVIPAIMLLFTVRPRPTAGAFLLGWALGVGAVVVGAVLVADLLDVAGTAPAWISWTRIVLGVLLVLYGAKQWMGRGGGEMPGWMRSLQEATPQRAVSLGLLLSAANPKVALLALSGGLTIGAAAAGPTAQVGMVLLFVVIASLSVAAPLTAHLVAGDRVLEPLGAAKGWLEQHNDAVMAVVLAVLGVLLGVTGVQGL